jgi:hypothetical protein
MFATPSAQDACAIEANDKLHLHEEFADHASKRRDESHWLYDHRPPAAQALAPMVKL